MKRIFLILAAIVLLLSSDEMSFALSDPEYLQMKRDSPEYARSEAKLQRVWDNLKKSMSKSAYSYLLDEQREWIRRGRDEEAYAYIRHGYSRIEAYTIVTNERADYLPMRAREITEGKENRGNNDSAARKFLGVQ